MRRFIAVALILLACAGTVLGEGPTDSRPAGPPASQPAAARDDGALWLSAAKIALLVLLPLVWGLLVEYVFERVRRSRARRRRAREKA